jgi:hypothetical protein
MLFVTKSNHFYRERPNKEDLEGSADLKIGGKVMRSAKCTDSLVLLAKDQTVLQSMADGLIEVGRCYGVEMNVERTNEMRISKQPFPIQITIDYKLTENEEYFNSFGSLITNDARYNT